MPARKKKGQPHPEATGPPAPESVVAQKSFRSAKGNTYRIIQTTEVDGYEEAGAMVPAVAPAQEHFGMCDASAAAAVGPALFVAANDEDNVLRVYRRDRSGPPVHTFDLDSFLAVDPDHPEADLEGAARVGDRVYWVTSHGTDKDGDARPSRRRLFATEVRVDGQKVTVTPVGKPYTRLVEDLARAPALAAYDLAAAATRPPKSDGGLNIEGLAATPLGALLIAFRNPLPGGRALVVPLLNPDEVVQGRAAQLGPPVELPLDGLGVRSIDSLEDEGTYLILAGPHNEGTTFHLYRWSGSGQEAPQKIRDLSGQDWQPEGLLTYPDELGAVYLLSDDGEKKVGGKKCKKADPGKRSFRSFRVTF